MASTMNRATRSAPSTTVSADRTLPPPSATNRTSLARRQPVERQEQGDGQILSQLRAAVGRERCRINDGLRQPWTYVLLASRARRFQHVETNPRRRSHEKRSRIRYVVAVGLMPTQ